jgi:hypothetical protein
MNIYYITGSSEKTLDKFTHNFSEPPKLIWLEPRPTLINGKVGLKEVDLKNVVQGLQIPLKTFPWFEILDGVFIEEVRFYWKDSMLHLLVQEDELGYRYFGCSENKDFLNSLELSTVKSKEVDAQIRKNQVSKIFLRRDLERFKLDNTLEIDKVQVVSYWHENSLWAWRLLPEFSH